jgi:DNA-binding SARP family transcriptional activator
VSVTATFALEAPCRSPAPVAIRALGLFRVLRGIETVSPAAWQSKKARDLLKILVARRGRPAARDALMEILWPEQDPKRTANRLSVALSTARAVLDPGHRFGADRFIRADRSTVRLNLESVACDVERFLHLASEGLARRRAGWLEGAAELLEAAYEAYAGDFLEEDPYEEWAVPLREEARADYLAVTGALAELADARGEGETAIGYRLRVLDHDPYDEPAHLTIVTAHEAAGRHGEARRSYARYQARMREIGVEPAPFLAAVSIESAKALIWPPVAAYRDAEKTYSAGGTSAAARSMPHVR